MELKLVVNQIYNWLHKYGNMHTHVYISENKIMVSDIVNQFHESV